jgi:exodeoxyribonuclease-3
MKICTWNINSIRTRLDLLLELFRVHSVDVLMLQETKCSDEHFPVNFFEENALNVVFTGQKSTNGVAIVSRMPIEITQKHLPNTENLLPYNNTRYIEGLINVNGEVLKIASVYVPNGDSPDIIKRPDLMSSERFLFKLKFLDCLNAHIKQMKKFDEKFIISGDYNVAKTQLDIFSYKSAFGGVGCHPLEHEKIANLESQATDIFRHIYPSDEGYTWYDYRHQRFSKKEGWRIDYHYVSENLVDKCRNVFLLDEIRGREKTSDHLPVVLDLDI